MGLASRSGEEITVSVLDAILSCCGMIYNCLQVTEVQTFLPGTAYEQFGEWLLRAGKHNWRNFDRNKDGALTADELKEASRMFLQEIAEAPAVTVQISCVQMHLRWVYRSQR